MKQVQSALAHNQARTSAPPVVGSLVSVSNPDRITEAWTALPELTIDPDLMKQGRIVGFEGGAAATEIDVMRTRALQQMRDSGWRRLGITSPTAGCGKSTVALNLAMSLQRHADLHILLIELDLRRPTLARLSGITHDISFAHMLDGASGFGNNAVRYAANLAIATNAQPRRNAAELLGGANVAESLRTIEAGFAPDVMLFDMPAMLGSDDAMAFARHLDCALIVAGAGDTTIDEIDRCESELASQTNVMGVVLNKCRYMR